MPWHSGKYNNVGDSSMRIASDYLMNKACNYLLELGLDFLRAGRLKEYDELLAVARENNAEYMEDKDATNKKRPKNKRVNGKTLRKGRGRKSPVRKYKRRKD